MGLHDRESLSRQKTFQRLQCGATTQKGDRTRELREEKGKIERRLRSLGQQGGSIWLRELKGQQ